MLVKKLVLSGCYAMVNQTAMFHMGEVGNLKKILVLLKYNTGYMATTLVGETIDK